MIIRKAAETDIDAIEGIYDRILSEEESGRATIGWVRGVYPTRKTAEASLSRDDLFVMEDEGSIVATAIINRIQVPEYSNARWKHEAADEDIMVLHTLIVDPLQKARGYGKAFVAYYEEYAAKEGCRELRMDTNKINSRARNMYAHLGYEEVDIVDCVFNGIPGVKLVCLEKYL
ncbi:MAG: GNAT family N-acetyltransferase [Lachnospiraceae bacterium]|nr:GNAT family N-acetyltransferase [Lachnospiraceae bacterium]